MNAAIRRMTQPVIGVWPVAVLLGAFLAAIAGGLVGLLGWLAGFWVIGFRQGLRFADDELEPPIRIEVTEPYWAMKPG